MIPKVIHYCWFGRGPKGEKEKKCIDSWKKYCPEYEFVEWNEDNFDIESNAFVKEAYENKKYAFVTDVVRLYALYNYGGIYMDTDVELVKSPNEFLKEKAFSGFESNNWIPTGLMASEKGLPLFKELLDYYDDKHFVLEDGSLDTTTNCVIITDICKKHGLVLNGQYQIVDGFALYPSDYFCPFENETGKLSKTNNTVAIHWFAKSWMNDSTKTMLKLSRVLHRLFGTENIHKFAVKLGLR